MDIRLPDLEGLSILRGMKESNPSLPVIVLTGYATVENMIEPLVNSAFAYLTRPYNRKEIKAILRRAVAVNLLASKGDQVRNAGQGGRSAERRTGASP